MRIRLGHSPDPDDAFMFWALTTDLVERRGFEFEQVLQDIQTLNEWALQAKLEVTAISLHAYPFVQDSYALLPHGASIGDKYGPILVAKEPRGVDEIGGMKIAIPGELTSAFLALRLYNSEFQYEVRPFDQITDAVLKGEVDAGLLIHEGQLFYKELGLDKVLDLGEWWFERTGLPLPMGGNAIKRDLGEDLMKQVSRHLHSSIMYSMENREDALQYAMQFARDMAPDVADRFVAMWVNELTLDYGERGKEGVRRLLAEGYEAGIIPHKVDIQFVD